VCEITSPPSATPSPNDTAEAVAERRRATVREQGIPGNRDDGARLALVIEGGSSRGAYSSGMTVAIERLGLLPLFDAVYGSSAGALNGAWLLCGRAGSTMHAWWDPAVMRGTIDPRRALRRRPIVDTHFLVHTVYAEILPMGFQEILDNPVEFHPMATDAQTGASTDLREHLHDRASLQAALRASTAMPLLAGRPVEIDGRRFVDAGVSEPVPVQTALAQNATHLVALRTRRSDERVRPPDRAQRLVLSRWFARHAPGALEPWLRREVARAEEEQILAAHPAALRIRPPIGSAKVGRTERGEVVLKQAVHTGLQAATDALGPAGLAAVSDREGGA
jgi:predicted patatin/cPLA2 family phospholipase